MSFENNALVCNMSCSSTDVTAKTTQLQFYALGRRVTLLRDYQRKLRYSGKDYVNMARDIELIELDCNLAHGVESYEKGFTKTLKLQDDILKESIARVEELKKLLSDN